MTNHTDKELLMLAAKAAGYEIKLDRHSMEVRIKSGSIWPCWNPLANDGEALRLAVRLDMLIDPNHGKVACCSATGGFAEIEEPFRSSKFAATRRAIVRVAAAIGEKL